MQSKARTRKNEAAQSAMEYLMTYGWAILIIAVVLAILYQLGVFTGSSFATTGCLAQSGYTCQRPIMNTTGNVTLTLGQISAQTITITQLGCSNTQSEPTMVSPPSGPIVLPSSSVNTTTFKCPISSNSLGTYFTGYLWIGYTTPTQPTAVVAEIATLTVSSSTTGLVGPPVPVPIIIATGQSYQPLVATDGTNVYWANHVSAGNVLYCPASSCGSSPTTLNGDGSTYFDTQPAASGVYIFWVDGDNEIWYCLIASCTAMTVTSAGPNGDQSIIAYGGTIYWANYNGQIKQCTASNCQATATTITTDSGYPAGLATDGTNIYWTDRNSGKIMECTIASCTPTMLASGYSNPIKIAYSNGYIFWISGSGLSECSVSSCTPTLISSDNINGVAASGDTVYWTDYSYGKVEQCTAASCTTTEKTTAMDANDPGPIAASGSLIAWSNGDGQIISFDT